MLTLLHTPSIWLVQSLVGRPSVFRLQSVGSEGELIQGKPKGSRNAVCDVPGGVGYSTLQTSDRGSVKVGGVGKGLLGKADFLSA
jgi:hypothetical protein